MSRKHAKYGTYYGDLYSHQEMIENEFSYSDIDTESFINELLECGVVEILFDVEEGEDYSDTVFFEVDDNTDMCSLMCLIANKRPHEFSMESDKCFRMWFD